MVRDYDGEPGPGVQRYEHVSHYYGDFVRQLFIAGTALLLLGAPFYTDDLRGHLIFIVLAAIVLIALAALTNPKKRSIIVGDAVAGGLVLLVFQYWAFADYDHSSWIQFILREVIAIIFVAAFYFSVKTLRAFMLRQIGKHDEAGEFDADDRANMPRKSGTEI